jgi:large subunit ribosomal protein L32
MALPAKKMPRHKTRQRRSHYALKEISYRHCSHCGKPVLPHQACSFCGYYKGQPLVQVKVKKKKIKK